MLLDIWPIVCRTGRSTNVTICRSTNTTQRLARYQHTTLLRPLNRPFSSNCFKKGFIFTPILFLFYSYTYAYTYSYTYRLLFIYLPPSSQFTDKIPGANSLRPVSQQRTYLPSSISHPDTLSLSLSLSLSPSPYPPPPAPLYS
jgi:hypothetical protein